MKIEYHTIKMVDNIFFGSSTEVKVFLWSWLYQLLSNDLLIWFWFVEHAEASRSYEKAVPFLSD